MHSGACAGFDMGVQYYKPRNRWCYQWQESGIRRKKYFMTEQEARDYEREHLAANCSDAVVLSLGELVALYFRSHTDKHQKTKRNIVYFLAGHEGPRGHVEGAGEFLRDKIADRLTRTDLEAMREAMRARGAKPGATNLEASWISTSST